MIGWGGVCFVRFILLIMNLLDQLYQYSLRSDGSSLSLSALSCDQNLEISLVSHRSNTLSAVPTSDKTISTWFIESKTPKNCENDGVNVQFPMEMEVYQRVKQKYRKLSKMVQLFGNKIRKIQYEFLVKLELKHKDHFSFQHRNELGQGQLTKSLIFDEIYKDRKINFWDKICRIHQIFENNTLKQGFGMISKHSTRIQKFQYLYQTLFSLFKNKKKSQEKNFLSLLKGLLPKINKSHIIQLNLQSTKVIPQVENSIKSQFQFHENMNVKASIIHPQRRLMQNIDICDNLSIFMCLTQEIFQKQQLTISTIKKVQQKDYLSQKRKSDLTNFSLTASQLEQCPKMQTQYVLDQKITSEVPLFDLQESACFKHHQGSSPKSLKKISQNEEKALFSELNQQILGHRFSLDEHQSELNKYIIFRRSIEKKKHSTLKDIERSKQTIKKIVYQLQKSKAKNQKQKIKLTNKNIISNNKSSEKKTPVAQSIFSSPLRSKSIGNKIAKATPSKKCGHDSQLKLFSTKDYQYSENPVSDELCQLQTPSKNLEVYYNYMKAKRKSVKIDEPSHKKQPSKQQIEANPSKKKVNQRQKIPQATTILINKDPALRQRRIDVKVDLSKVAPSTKLLKEKSKGAVKTSRK